MSDKRLNNALIALVIAPDQFRDEELFVPKESFEAEGAKVIIASTTLDEAKGMLGKSAKPEVLISGLKAEELDAVVVVGGMGSPQYLWDNQELKALLNEMHNKDKVVSAICLSGAVLGNAGVLKGKKATVWETEESKAALKNGGAQYVKEPVVADGKIITANGPEAACDFARAIINELISVKVS